ncbi:MULTISPECIES: HlyD family secretion protein [Flavobacteriaceae]|uniref:HlyD family secretion protein n=2 Tax=Flavobacteriaceae TaxID=49546 RepID=A0A4Y8AWV5_9FLAO|nr:MULTISPECIES: HlyD family secretion protein [Flavobacteriaceae]TEW76512.1 HlyD family secretion protein [Gramella jeungdoensis]GGK53606.1 multidrug resistance protein [Lutibacter litoralis]
MSNNKTQTEKKSTKNKRFVFYTNLLVFIVAITALMLVVKYYFHIGDKNFTNDAQVEAYINPINTRVSAYIKEIKFEENQKVKKGDTLVILDDSEIKAKVTQAEAAYLNALAGEQTTLSSVNTISNNTHIIEANIAGAESNLWNAEQNLKRFENLLKEEAVTQQQYDGVKTQYDAANAQYKSLLGQRKSVDYSLKEMAGRIEMSKAGIKQAQAALELAKLNLSYTIITAPYDGFMGRRIVNEGQLLNPSQQVASIITSDKKWVIANFRETQMESINIGTAINVKVDALGGKKYMGKVTSISAATGSRLSSIPVDNSTGNFVKVQQRIPVRIDFTEENAIEDLKLLRVGMNVDITLK